jgi:hypothetical protein
VCVRVCLFVCVSVFELHVIFIIRITFFGCLCLLRCLE